MLIFARAKIDVEDRDYSTPLMLAARAGHLSIVRHLIASSARTDKKRKIKQTALVLCRASRMGEWKVVKTLLNVGVRADEVDEGGCTPLVLAARGRYVGCVSYLIEHGADITKQDKSGKTALSIIVENVPLKLSATISIHEICREPAYFYGDFDTAVLSHAVIHNLRNAAKILIANGVGIERPLHTISLMTALMWTAQNGYDSLTKQLILRGVNVIHQNPDGYTALHYAALYNHIQCGILLVEAGADVSTVNKVSQTPLDLSSREFKDAILQALSFQAKKTVCVIGNAFSGKSTLIASLQNENARFWTRWYHWLFGVSNISDRTAGIEPISISSKRYGNVMFFDFAGQHEYHGPHEMFLESILSNSLSTVTIIVVVKATEDESAILHQLHRWMHPLSKIPSSGNPVQMIVVGSHMDKVKHKAEAEKKLELCYEKVKDNLRAAPLEFKDLCYLNCRQLYSSDITSKLCTYLSDVPPPQYKARDNEYSVCWVISRIRSFFEVQVIPACISVCRLDRNQQCQSPHQSPASRRSVQRSVIDRSLPVPSEQRRCVQWLVGIGPPIHTPQGVRDSVLSFEEDCKQVRSPQLSTSVSPFPYIGPLNGS